MTIKKLRQSLSNLWEAQSKLNADCVFPVVPKDEVPSDARIIKKNENGEWVSEDRQNPE